MLQLDIGTLASSNSFHSVKATPLRCHVNGQTIIRHRGLYSDVIVAAVHVSAVLPIAAAAILHNNQPVSHHPAAPLDAWHYKLLPTTSTLTIRRCLQMALAVMVQLQVLTGSSLAADLLESNLSSEGNIPSELSAAGEAVTPRLSSLLSGSNKKQVEGCTRRCVPTCIRGGEGAPGLGPLSMRRDIVVFKQGFRSRSYCLSECAQVCSLIVQKDSTAAAEALPSPTAAGDTTKQDVRAAAAPYSAANAAECSSMAADDRP